MTTRWRRALLWTPIFSLALIELPQTAVADLAIPVGPGLLSGRSARYALFVVVGCALTLSAAGIFALWRMSRRSASFVAAASEVSEPREAEGT